VNMASRILKGLAVAAGTGLAMGLTSGRVGRARLNSGPRAGRYYPAPLNDAFPASHTISDDQDVEILDIDPLLDRLERLEARVESIGTAPLHPVVAPVASEIPRDLTSAIADLERRVTENTRELALLRVHIEDAERRAAESVASMERSVAKTRAELPAMVEQHVAARVEDLRNRFTAEIEQSERRTMEIFEHAIDEKISSRISSIERALGEQAGSIEALTVRTVETDSNLQRLVAAIEKLCERAQLIAPSAEPQLAQAPAVQRARQYEAPLPFESQMQDAMRREPVVPILRTEEPLVEVQVPVPTFATGDGPGQSAPKKSRFLFRNLIVAGFGFLATRFLR
jgi:hypothetical protein